MSLVSTAPAPGEFKLAVGMSVFCNNELGESAKLYTHSLEYAMIY